MGSPAAGTRYFRVKNLDKYQHYRDRNPPWIKLHQSVTEDTAFALLPDAAKGHLMLIWLLASRMDNRLPFDPVFIGARINAREAVDLNLLLGRGFLVFEPLARRKRGASAPLSKAEHPHRDIEQRTERENNDPPSPPASAGGPVNGNGHGPLTNGQLDATVRELNAYWRRLATWMPGGWSKRPLTIAPDSSSRKWRKDLKSGRVKVEDIREAIAARVRQDLEKHGVPVWDAPVWPPEEAEERRAE